MSYIEVNRLSKKYYIKKKKSSNKKKEVIEALKEATFKVEKGDIVGYIGPNGAGKSTTIKLLSGILKPDNGNCVVDNIEPWKNRKKYVKKIGVLFGQRSQLLWDLPAIDTFEMLRSIYGMDKKEYAESLEYLDAKLGLKELYDKPVRQMSLGQRMRCEFAATFIHNPELVFLDEPTIGIDIEVKEKIHEFIKAINKERNVTVFITSHDIDDIQTVCNRIIIVNQGEIYYDGTIEDICNGGYIDHKVIVELSKGSELSGCEDYTVKELEDNKYSISIKNREDVGQTISSIARINDVLSITVENASLEDVLLKIYKSFKE